MLALISYAALLTPDCRMKGGRIEAVMVSCPPLVAWDYNYTPAPNSEEDRLQQILRTPREWA